jgi:glucose/arabinose dehydrogenase
MYIIKKLAIGIICLGIVGFGIFYYKYKAINIPQKVGIDLSEELPFTLPEEFVMSVFAENVPGARVIAYGPSGEMLVSQPSENKITSLYDSDGDGKADEIGVVAENLNRPHGLAFHCYEGLNCTLYVANTDALMSFDYDAEERLAVNPKKLLDLPGGGAHFTRTLLFLSYPDENTLLISVGSSCNVCNENDLRRGSIIFYDIQTKESGLYATGLRNSVFLELHPIDGRIYATEMGRDGLGDNIPPDEINIVEKGKDYGWPICYGKNIHDTNFDKNTYIRNPCMEPFETESLIDLQAHSAPLGLAFIPEEGWEEKDWFSMIVAYHGSWNRSVPTGYKLVKISMNEDGSYGEPQDFITGWLRDDGVKIGRPVDIKIFPGGTMFISDDGAGVIYKIKYKR